MTTKTNIRVLGLAALVGIIAGFTVPAAFAYPDEAAILAPAIADNVFPCSPNALGSCMDSDRAYPAYDMLGFTPYGMQGFTPYGMQGFTPYNMPNFTPQEEANLKAELNALYAAYVQLFDKFSIVPTLSEEQQAEFDAQILALDEEHDAVLVKIGAALVEEGDVDTEPLFETLITIDAKYEQLFDKFYPKSILSEEQRDELDIRLGALDWVYDSILEKYGIEPEHLWFIEDWYAILALGLEWSAKDAYGLYEKETTIQ